MREPFGLRSQHWSDNMIEFATNVSILAFRLLRGVVRVCFWAGINLAVTIVVGRIVAVYVLPRLVTTEA